MVEIGRREVVSDPLALNPREKEADRSLPTYGVRNPQQGAGNAVTKRAMQSLSIIDGLQVVAGRAMEAANKEAFTNGKIAYMQGATDQEIASMGDKNTTQGYETLKSIDTAQQWFTQQQQFIATEGAGMDPTDYRKHLMGAQKEALKNLPNDPRVRAAWAASFEDFAPRLASDQVKANNDYNGDRAEAEGANILMSGSQAYSDRSSPSASGEYRTTAQPIRIPVQHTAYDKEILIKTVLGEAAGEGEQGMAAVAHVVVNRSEDKRWGGSLSKVALEDKQFSAWNKGEGGNNPDKWKPGTEAWRRAEGVVDAVLAGRHVDPTNGAVNYYAPKGMDGGIAPAWSSGKGIKIGNHLYEGQKQTKAGSANTGLIFRNKGQENIQPEISNILTETSAILGKDLVITSGRRSAEHNAAVGGAKESEHVPGNASDIDMSGMSEDERMNLVQTLRAKGMRRFGTYDNNPNMLHVDMSEANGEEWFMHNKSNDFMGKAPDWFKKVAGASRPTENGIAIGEGGTQTQRMIANLPLKGPRKARAVVTAMVRTLDSGDDTMFNDAGGVGILYSLGADASDVDKVLKAKDRFDTKKDKEFDINIERERAEILSRVNSGEFNNLDEVFGAVDEFQKKNSISASEARSLARAVQTEWDKSGDNARVPLELRDLSAKLYDQINTGALDAREAAEQIEEYARANPKIKSSTVDSFIQDMYSSARTRDNKARTDAETAFKKKEKETAVVNRATQALTQGVGLKGLTGTVSIPDPANPNKTKEVNGEEYGIWALKKSTMDSYNPQVAAGDVDKDSAGVSFYNDVYEKLAKQDVYDRDFGRQVAAAVHGNIVDPETKQPTDAAMDSLSFYMQMRDNPEVGIEYLHGMIEDPQARTFLETAANLYDGQNDISTALMRASERLSQPVTSEMKLDRNTEFYKAVDKSAEKNINAITERGTWLARVLPGTFDDARVEKTVSMNRQLFHNYIGRQAETYHLLNPREPVEVSVKKASADLQRNAIVVGTNVLLGNEQKGTRLDQIMGIEDMGKTAPHTAIHDYVNSFAEKQWGALWTSTGNLVTDQYNPVLAVGSNHLAGERGKELQITYDSTSGTLSIQPYKDGKMTETVGEPMFLDAALVGKWYKQQLRNRQGEGEGTRAAWRGFVDAYADGEQRARGTSNDAGTEFGKLFEMRKNRSTPKGDRLK